jgi:hypothetical protein
VKLNPDIDWRRGTLR